MKLPHWIKLDCRLVDKSMFPFWNGNIATFGLNARTIWSNIKLCSPLVDTLFGWPLRFKYRNYRLEIPGVTDQDCGDPDCENCIPKRHKND